MRTSVVGAPPAEKPKPYVYQAYPKMKYHRLHKPVVVKDAAQEEKLGPEWASKPFPEQVPELAAAPCPRCEALTQKFDEAYRKLQADLAEVTAQYEAAAAERDELLERATAAETPSLPEMLAAESPAPAKTRKSNS